MDEFPTLHDRLKLHESIEITWVMGGFLATFAKHDGATNVISSQGATISEALRNLDIMLRGATKEQPK